MVLSNTVLSHRLSHPHFWVSTIIFEPHECHADYEVVPKISSRALAAIKDPGIDILLANVFNSKLWSTYDEMLL